MGLRKKDLAKLNSEREETFRRLRRHGASVWEVFDGSGIGGERNSLATDFTKGFSSLLDVASGRGYFTFAVARLGAKVVALDVMDGRQRAGWWKAFTKASRVLDLARQVEGIRGDGSRLPFPSKKFGVVSSIHAFRNFPTRGSIRKTIAEMARVLAADGRLLVAESTLQAESPAEEVYLDYFKLRTRIGWEMTPPSRSELERLTADAGLSRLSFTERRFHQDYAPLEFPTFFIQDQPPKVREEHRRIERLRSKHGIKPTSVMVLVAEH